MTATASRVAPLTTRPSPRWYATGTAIVLALAAAKLLLHLLAANGYGIFRDELYFIVCGWRLDWGYVDHPPMIPLLARMGTALFGTTAFGVRFFAAVTGACLVALAGLTARELGGGRFAQGMASLATLVAPHYLGSQGKLATDTVEPLFWGAASYVLVRIIQREETKLWPWFGLFAGLGFETKHSTVFFGFAVVVALLITPARRLMWNRWFALAGLIAFLVFLPNLLWEMRHDWATLELLRNVKNSQKNIVLGPGKYFLSQFGMMHPLSAPVWLAGVGWFLLGGEGRRWRVFGLAYVILFVLFVVLKGKAYYLASVYVVLFAGGAVWLEMVTRRRQWLRGSYATLLVVSTIPIVPLALPVLPPQALVAYQRKLGFRPPATERSHTAELAQHFADCFGWQEMAASVARVYQSLPEQERKQAAIFVQNYGQAGALDVYGGKWGLPPALSGHQNYFLWGTHGWRGEVLIVMDDEPGTLPQLCGSVEDRGPVESHPLAMPWEQRQRLYVCRGLKQPLEAVWPRVKRWL